MIDNFFNSESLKIDMQYAVISDTSGGVHKYLQPTLLMLYTHFQVFLTILSTPPKILG